MSLKVSLVVVNYNGEDFLRACLNSIRGQSRPADELIVVDNASTDNSLDILGSYPEVILLRQERNLGFAAGCNRGIEKASGELIGILNNDITLDRDWLRSLLAEVTDEWDFWASLIVFAAQEDRIDSAGDGMAVIGAAYKIGHGEATHAHTRSREVFGPCAAAALYRRELLKATGGFDEDFFLIYEDADLNMRARLQGFRCRYVPDARVNHHVNSSIGTFSRNYVYFGHRNSEYVFWKNMPLPLLLLYLPERLLFDLICLGYFLARGRGLTFLEAKWQALKSLPAIRRKRKRIQQTRSVTTRQAREMLTRNWLRYRLKPARTP